MLTFDEIQAIVNEIECKPYVIRFDCTQCVRLREQGTTPPPECPSGGGHAWFMQARLWRPDADTGQMGWGGGGKYQISPHSTRDEIVKRALTACLAYAEHEVREAFMWRGRRVFGPHLSVAALWDAADCVEERWPIE